MKLLIALACSTLIVSSQSMDTQLALLLDSYINPVSDMTSALAQTATELNDLAKKFADAGKTLQVLVAGVGDTWCYKTWVGLTEQYSGEDGMQSYTQTLEWLSENFETAPIEGSTPDRNSYASILYAASQFSQRSDVRRIVILLADQCRGPAAKGSVTYGKIPQCGAEVSMDDFVEEILKLRTGLLYSSVKLEEEMVGPKCSTTQEELMAAGYNDVFYDGRSADSTQFDTINRHLPKMLDAAWLKTTSTLAPQTRIQSCIQQAFDC